MTSQTPRETTSRSLQGSEPPDVELLLISEFVPQVTENGDSSVCLGSPGQEAVQEQQAQQEHLPRWD